MLFKRLLQFSIIVIFRLYRIHCIFFGQVNYSMILNLYYKWSLFRILPRHTNGMLFQIGANIFFDSVHAFGRVKNENPWEQVLA